MKKFYTLLAVAAITLSASATELAGAKQFETVQFATGTELKTPKSVRAMEAQKRDLRATRAELAIAGESFMFISATGLSSSDYLTTEPITITPVSGENYTIKNLLASWFGTVKDVPCTIKKLTDTDEQGTYEYLELTIKSKTEISTGYSLYLFGYEGTQPTVYPDDITFFSFDGENWYFDYEDCGIAFITAKMSGSWVMNPQFTATNGSYTATDVDFDDNDNKVTTEISGKIYALYKDSALMLCSFGGFTRPVVFVVDEAAKTATATNQICEDWYINNKMYSSYLSGSADSVTPVTATVAVGAGKTTLTFADPYFAYIQGLGWAAYQENGKVTIDEELFAGSGVASIAAEENAPVEYYNLQGIRVANPENGLYIIKQGAKTSKVLVK